MYPKFVMRFMKANGVDEKKLGGPEKVVDEFHFLVGVLYGEMGLAGVVDYILDNFGDWMGAVESRYTGTCGPSKTFVKTLEKVVGGAMSTMGKVFHRAQLNQGVKADNLRRNKYKSVLRSGGVRENTILHVQKRGLPKDLRVPELSSKKQKADPIPTSDPSTSTSHSAAVDPSLPSLVIEAQSRLVAISNDGSVNSTNDTDTVDSNNDTDTVNSTDAAATLGASAPHGIAGSLSTATSGPPQQDRLPTIPEANSQEIIASEEAEVEQMLISDVDSVVLDYPSPLLPGSSFEITNSSSSTSTFYVTHSASMSTPFSGLFPHPPPHSANSTFAAGILGVSALTNLAGQQDAIMEESFQDVGAVQEVIEDVEAANPAFPPSAAQQDLPSLCRYGLSSIMVAQDAEGTEAQSPSSSAYSDLNGLVYGYSTSSLASDYAEEISYTATNYGVSTSSTNFAPSMDLPQPREAIKAESLFGSASNDAAAIPAPHSEGNHLPRAMTEPPRRAQQLGLPTITEATS